MRELTVMLIYLSRFSQGEKFDEATDFYAWKLRTKAAPFLL